RIDLRIVGAFAAGGDPQPGGGAGDGEQQHQQADAHARLPQERGLLRDHLFPHQRTPPRSRRSAPCEARGRRRRAPLARVYPYCAAMNCSLATATASCAWTTSMLLATPAAKRSRACVSCCAARSRALPATVNCCAVASTSRNAARTS